MNDEKRQLKTELFRNPANDVVISLNLKVKSIICRTVNGAVSYVL